MRAALLDTQFGSDLIAREMVRAGVEVIRIGRIQKTELIPWCTSARDIDYSSRAEVLEIVRETGITTAVSGSTDLSFCATMSLNRTLGKSLFGLNFQWEHAIDKNVLQQTLSDAGIPIPMSFEASAGGTQSLEPRSGLLIVKPADAFSGRGVTKVAADNLLAVQKALKSAEQASPSGAAVIQEWIPGDLFSLSCLVEHSRVVDFHVVREYGLRNPWAVDASFVTAALDGLASTLRGYAHKIAHSIGLERGLLHAQFISDGASVSFLEVFHRMPGDLYGALIELSEGPGYVSNYTNAFLGKSISASKQPERRTPVLRLTLPRTLTIVSGPLEQIISEYQLEAIDLNDYFAVRSEHPSTASGRQVIFLKSKTPFEQLPSLFVELGEILRA